MAGQESVLEGGQDGVVVSDHSVHHWAAGSDTPRHVVPHFFLDGARLPAGGAQFGQRGGSVCRAWCHLQNVPLPPALPCSSWGFGLSHGNSGSSWGFGLVMGNWARHGGFWARHGLLAG